MAQTLPKMVKAKSGREYDAASPQGQMIVNSAKPAFSPDSKALSSVSNSLTTISANVVSIGESVAAMVLIAQADSRGDALNKSNVEQTGLDKAAVGGAGGMSDNDLAAQQDENSTLGGLGGMAGFIGGLGKGLTFWGAAGPGALVFTAFLAGLVGLAYAGSVAFQKSAPKIAEGMEAISAADVDPDKVIQIGKALAIFGGAMAAQGLGAGISGLGTLVGGIADGLAGFLGIEKKDPMVALKEFAKTEITEAELKQIEINARGLTVFSAAMAVSAGGDVLQDIGGLIGGVARGLTALIPGPRKPDPMIRMRAFADHIFTDGDVAQIKRNAAALIGFQSAMAVTESIGVVEDIANLASGIVNGLASLFPEGKDPMLEMRKFADHKFTEDEVKQIKLNAGALLAFSSTMGVAKTMGAVGDITGLFGGIANGISSLFGLEKKDPMADMKKFAETKITQAEADQIGLNASALVAFSKAMAIYSAGGAAGDALDLVGSMAKGITNFFGGTTGIDYEEIKTFANSGLDTLETKITTNARVLGVFSKTMSDNASASAGVEWTNIGTNILGAIGSIFGSKAEDKIPYEKIKTFANSGLDGLETKIVANAKTLGAFSTAMKDNASAEADAGWVNIKANFLGAIGSLFGGKPEDDIPYDEITKFAGMPWTETTEVAIVRNAKILSAFSTAMKEKSTLDADPGATWTNIKANLLGAVGSIFGGKPEDSIPYDKITTFAAMPWTEATTKSIVANAATLHAYTTAIATMGSLKQDEGFWSSVGSTLSGAFSAVLGQDSLPIEEIQEFTAIDLDLKKVENNISAIEAFMNFGTKMKDWSGGDMGDLADLGRNMTAAAQGIYIAMYGGKNFEGNDYALDPSNSLTQIDLVDFTRVSKGVNLLTAALGISAPPVQQTQDASSGNSLNYDINNNGQVVVLPAMSSSNGTAPLQQLKAVSAEMNASTGGVTVVNANNNSSTSSSSTTTTIELEATNRDSASQLFMSTIPSMNLGN